MAGFTGAIRNAGIDLAARVTTFIDCLVELFKSLILILHVFPIPFFGNFHQISLEGSAAFVSSCQTVDACSGTMCCDLGLFDERIADFLQLCKPVALVVHKAPNIALPLGCVKLEMRPMFQCATAAALADRDGLGLLYFGLRGTLKA